MQNITIALFDYSTGTLHTYQVEVDEDWQIEDIETLIQESGYKLSETSWMELSHTRIINEGLWKITKQTICTKKETL